MEAKHQKTNDEAKELTTRQEKEIKLVRIEYTKQVKENDATVIRYRKMIEDEKEFAITKFAKDLMEVRDAVRMSIEHFDIDAVKAEEDIEALKEKFVGTMEGQ